MRYDDEKHRSSGLSRPWDPLQVLSWILIIIFVALFYTFNGLFLPSPLQYAFSILYGGAAVLTVILNVLTARSDAADPAIFTKLSEQEMYRGSIPADRALCQLCRAYTHKSSKHCGSCNKCVIGFDHHCKWLNNCIGGTNYRLFFVFVTVGVCTLCFQFAIAFYQFIDSFLEPRRYADRLEDLYGTRALALYRSFDGFIMILAFIAFLLLLHLFGFHIMLACKGITTYEWIIRRRNRKAGGPPPGIDEQDNCKPSDGALGNVHPQATAAAQRRYLYYEQRLPAAPDLEHGNPLAAEDESPNSGSGRSGSTQSSRSGQTMSKHSSMRLVHATPKGTHETGVVVPSRLSQPSVDLLLGKESAIPQTAIVDMPLPSMPPPLPPQLMKPPIGTRKLLDGEAGEHAAHHGHGLDLGGSATTDIGVPAGSAPCCVDVAELLLSQDSVVENCPNNVSFPQLNSPQTDL